MNNGQMNIASMLAVTQSVTQDPTAAVAVPIDGMQQNGGEFAGVLSGVQLVAKEKGLSVSGKAEQSPVKVGKQPIPLEAGTEDSAIGLLALLQVSPHITPASEPAAAEATDHEKADVSADADAVPPGSKPPDVTSQMALAAYLQPGRMPGVSNPTPLPVDKLQNVATATEQTVVITAPAVKNQAEQINAEQPQAATQNPAAAATEKTVVRPAAEQYQLPKPETVRTTAVDAHPVAIVAVPAPIVAASVAPVSVSAAAPAVQPEATSGTAQVNNLTSIPVEKLQNVATATGQPAAGQNQLPKPVTAKTTAGVDTQPVVQPVVTATLPPAPMAATATVAAASTVTPAFNPEATFTTTQVNNMTPNPVDELQNVAAVTEQPAVITAPSVKNQPEQTAAEPMQASAQTPAAAPTEKAVIQPAAEQNQHSRPEVRTLAVNMPPVAAVSAQPAPAPTVTTATAAPAVQQEATVIKSAPLPATAAQSSVAATPTTFGPEDPAAYPGIKASASSPESELEIQLSQPKPITARVTAAPVLADNRPAALVQELRTGNERSAEKEEMAPLLQNAVSPAESTVGSDSSNGSDSNQGQPDVASGNQMLEQQMRGLLKTEHQRIEAVSTKAAPTEPGRQDIPGQVMQQVKEHFVQHDVKPGKQQITLTLSPDSLGELKMNLNLQGQKLSVEIVTENRAVRDTIVQHTDALKESLARQNITMESFDVTTGGKGSGTPQGQNQNAWRELAKQQQQQQLWASPRGYNTAQADLPSDQAGYQRKQGHSMLDIHY